MSKLGVMIVPGIIIIVALVVEQASYSRKAY